MDINIMGIYKIQNRINDKIYIGSSVDIHKRWLQHRSQLNKNQHHSKHLQNSWIKYGQNNFKFEIVELVSNKELLTSIEQEWINKTKCYDYNYGYNISIDARRPDIGDGLNQINAHIIHTEKIIDALNATNDKNERLVYYIVRGFVTFPFNCVVINDEIPTMHDLEPLLLLSDRAIRTALKSLEEKKLLKLVQSGHRKAIYINPEYYAAGKEIDTETLGLFGLCPAVSKRS